MRFVSTLISIGSVAVLAGIGRPAPAQPNGPAADKIDAVPVETSKTDTGQPPPETAPPVPPQDVTPSAATSAPAPSLQEPPRQEPSPKPTDTAGANETLETVGQGQAVAILGKKVVGPDGKAVLGSIIDLLVDGQGMPRAAVIDFGGFLGVGSRRVAIEWQSLKFRLDDRDAPVQLSLDPSQIKAAPEYKDANAPAQVVEPVAPAAAEAPPSPPPPAAPAAAPEEPQPSPSAQPAPATPPPPENAGQ